MLYINIFNILTSDLAAVQGTGHDLSPVPRMEKRPLSRALEGGFIAIKNCVNKEKMCQKRKKTKIFPLLFVPESSVL